jgi:uncharacterized protein (TIGR03790 family)
VLGERVGIPVAPCFPDPRERLPRHPIGIDDRIVHSDVDKAEVEKIRMRLSPDVKITSERLGIGDWIPTPKRLGAPFGRMTPEHSIILDEGMDATSGAKDASHLGESTPSIRHRLKNVTRDHQIERRIGERKLEGVAHLKRGAIGEASAARPGSLEVLFFEVDADERRTAKRLGEANDDLGRSASDVEDARAVRERMSIENRLFLRPNRFGLGREGPKHRLVGHLFLLRAVRIRHAPESTRSPAPIAQSSDVGHPRGMRFSTLMLSAPLFVSLSAGCGSNDKGGSGGDQSTSSASGGTASGGGGASMGTGGSATGGGDTGPEVIFPRTGITADEVGVLVNDDDPLSVMVAAYYVKARKIPKANVVHLHVGSATANSITGAVFAPLKTQVDTAFASSDVQALAITWTKPYAVDNMSVTSAFSLGYKAISSADTCSDTNAISGTTNPYQTNRTSTKPFTDLMFRPAMTIPATKIEEAKAIIDGGIASDDTWPTGTAYLMDTTDSARNVRCNGAGSECQTFLNTWDTVKTDVAASILVENEVTNKTDILFYVEGLASLSQLATNKFIPGSVADHLTSYGGQIPTSGQMSAFQFLLAGATGSYGTVVEPCNYTEKFPDPSVLIPTYFGGATLIEAYWKSVVWPAEGIFIGEPLARPWGQGYHSTFADGTLTIDTTVMVPGHMYLIEAGDSASGPFTTVMDSLSVMKYQKSTFTLKKATRKTYRFREAT